MSENTGETTKGDGKITRRQFLKKTALAAGGVALGGALLNEVEKDAVEKGISSGSGVFYPLYETHYEELDVDRIPDDLDILFREVAGGNLLTAPAKNWLMAIGTPFGKDKTIEVFSDEELQKIAIAGAEIMLGDIIAGPSRFPLTIVVGGTEFLAGLGIGLTLLKDFLKGKEPENNPTRRKFLKGAAKVAAGIGASWLMTPGIYALLRGGPTIGTFNTEREDALDRITDKIYGISTKLHPELIEEAFLRDIIMADKMLTVAEDFEQRTGRKAKIGFKVEYAHNGIEDFLRVGHDVCRWIIERYPTKVLKFVANQNDGNESLWTARLFKLPQDFSPGPNADWSRATDRTVVDVKLQKALAPRLT